MISKYTDDKVKGYFGGKLDVTEHMEKNIQQMNELGLQSGQSSGPTSAEREKANSNRSDDALDGGKPV